MKFEDFPVSSVGHTLQLVGAVWGGEGSNYIIYFPDEKPEAFDHLVHPSRDEWAQVLLQSDLMETEILMKTEDGKLVKAIARKCQRQIDQRVSWAVFRRDGYACRYCGNDKAPLTVDHLVLWEEGGPSTEDNLLASCKKCNKTRGNKLYHEWLRHKHYKKVSRNLTEDQRFENTLVAERLHLVQRHHKVKKR